MINACIDIGNTIIKYAVFSGDQMIYYELVEKNKYLRIIQHITENKIGQVIISTVAETPVELFDYFSQNQILFINLDHITPLPIDNLYNSKETLGKDRLAAVVGANYLYPHQNIMVIDAGSAITYDIINNSGQYLGGNIAPGIQMRYKALHTFTKRLPLLGPVNSFNRIGKDTNEAIIAGVQMGIIHEIDGNINMFKELYPDLKVILTGGDIKYFDNKLKNLIFVVSNLVLIGLNRILNYNVYKN